MFASNVIYLERGKRESAFPKMYRPTSFGTFDRVNHVAFLEVQLLKCPQLFHYLWKNPLLLSDT